MEKWFLRSRQLWAWFVGVFSALLGFLAMVDPAVANLLVAPLWSILAAFGVEVDETRRQAIRAALAAAGSLAAVLLVLWRRQRPDARALTVAPAPVSRLLGNGPPAVLLAAIAAASLACAHSPARAYVSALDLATRADARAADTLASECSDRKVRAARETAALCLDLAERVTRAAAALDRDVDGFRAALATGGDTTAADRDVRASACDLAAVVGADCGAL